MDTWLLEFLPDGWETDPDLTYLLPTPRTIGREILTWLTVLDEKRYACKVFKGGRAVQNAQQFKFNRAETFAANNLRELHDALKGRAQDHKTYLVRGALIDPRIEHNVRILRRHKPREGEPATLCERKSYFLQIDIDGEDLEGFDSSDPEGSIRAFIAKYPRLRGLRQSWQLSGSWGLKTAFCAHLILETETALGDADAKRLAKEIYPAADLKIYTPSQPWFFADPIYKDMEPTYTGPRWYYYEGDVLHVETGTAAAELTYWEKKIRALESGDGRHMVINNAGYYLGKYVAAEVWTADTLCEKLVAACEESSVFEPDRLAAAADEIHRAVADGERNAPASASGWMSKLHITAEGKIKNNVHNVLTVLREHPRTRGALRYNTRWSRVEWVTRQPWMLENEGDEGCIQYCDRDAVECVSWLNQWGLTAGSKTVHECIAAVAQDTLYDNARAALDGLPEWDRVARVDDALSVIGGTPNDLYHRAIGRKDVFMALVRRVYFPGTKQDDMPIAIGVEGLGKSTFWRDLVEWMGPEGTFSDTAPDYADAKKVGEALRGVVLCEDGELSKFKSREIESVKRCLSSVSDKYRPAFGRVTVDVPRRSIFAGSTNDEEPLNNYSGGNRRFKTFKMRKYDREWLLANREQLFAEAVWLVRQGAQCYFTREEEAARMKEQIDHMSADAWEELIGDWLSRGELDENGEPMSRDFVTCSEVGEGALRIPPSQHSRAISNRIASVLRRLGWERGQKRVNGCVRTGYVRGDELWFL